MNLVDREQEVLDEIEKRYRRTTSVLPRVSERHFRSL